MDHIIQNNIDELIGELRGRGADINDPVSKLMVTTLVHQAQKIRDEISLLPERVIENLAAHYIPADKVAAMPALCLVKPALKQKKDVEPHRLTDGSFYSFKIDAKTALTYYPIFGNVILPATETHLVFPPIADAVGPVLPKMRSGQVWVGLELMSEIESLSNVSFLIKGTSGILPEKICVGNNLLDLSFVSVERFEDIPMMEPFDTQQTSPTMVEVMDSWQKNLRNLDDCRLIYINDTLADRDIFKCKRTPKSFEQYGKETYNDNTLWLLFDFGSSYKLPRSLEIIPNVMPVVNVSLSTATLTQSAPVAKLTKNDGSFFLSVVETPLQTQKQGFGMVNDDVVIRNFDASGYNPDSLYRDVRNLYYRFIDDYHAFVDYHELKDGELLRSLREVVNRVGKSVVGSTDVNNRFDEGTYAMRSVKLSDRMTPIKIAYLTTNGRLGNAPVRGSVMENKKDAALEKDVYVITNAVGGEDKATPDRLYELLRYFTLTHDRLYTKMDVDAFVRLQLTKEFGIDEVRRIGYDISIQGAGSTARLVRGLYIDIKFRDAKNYMKAVEAALDRKLQQQIVDKSCISMPITVSLINLDTD